MGTTEFSLIPTPLKRAVRRHGRRAVLEAALWPRRRGGERPPPDFVIIGAQRCGTTSLFRALAQHPAMMPNVLGAKGVHYFDTDYQRDSRWYFAHFPTQAERDAHSQSVGQTAVAGEASPYYLFHPAGAERMARVIPGCKLVVLLRDPVKRAISHHLHMVWEGHEPIENIDEALDREAERLQGVDARLLADEALVSRAHQHYSYMARGHYAEQLERVFQHHGRENVLVMATETLVKDSEASLRSIQSFIGLEPSPAINLGKRNASAAFKPEEHTLERLRAVYRESNQRLRELVDVPIPWL